jgi:hypothetical protein
MTSAKNRSHKHFHLDAVKIKRAQKVLRAKTETKAIERALDLTIAEHERGTDWLSKPLSALSRVASTLRTCTARWVVRCSPPCLTLPFTFLHCVGETTRPSRFRN